MEMHGMKTVESGQYCAKEEILKAKMGADTYRNSGNTSREFNFVTAGELTVTITLNEYRELITGAVMSLIDTILQGFDERDSYAFKTSIMGIFKTHE